MYATECSIYELKYLTICDRSLPITYWLFRSLHKLDKYRNVKSHFSCVLFSAFERCATHSDWHLNIESLFWLLSIYEMHHQLEKFYHCFHCLWKWIMCIREFYGYGTNLYDRWVSKHRFRQTENKCSILTLSYAAYFTSNLSKKY